MTTSVEDLVSQAIALSEADRARLADVLLASLPDASDEDVEAAWDEEIKRRVAAIENGTAQLISAAEVHVQARAIYQR